MTCFCTTLTPSTDTTTACVINPDEILLKALLQAQQANYKHMNWLWTTDCILDRNRICRKRGNWGKNDTKSVLVCRHLQENLGLLDHLIGVSVESSWNVMAHGDAQEGKWKGNWRTTSEHGVSSITTADVHTSAAITWLNWRPWWFKWTHPFRRKTKSGFCVCAITFQPQSTTSMNLGKEEEGKKDRHRVKKVPPLILIRHFWFTSSVKHIGAPGGVGELGCSPPLPKRNLKNTDFVDTTIAKVLRDLCFDLNQSLKLALWPVWWNIKKCNKTFRCVKLFLVRLVLIDLVM